MFVVWVDDYEQRVRTASDCFGNIYDMRLIDDVAKARETIAQLNKDPSVDVSNDIALVVDTIIHGQSGPELASWGWRRGIRKICIISLDQVQLDQVRPSEEIVHLPLLIPLASVESHWKEVEIALRCFNECRYHRNMSIEDWVNEINQYLEKIEEKVSDGTSSN